MEEPPTLTFLKQSENNYSASASPDTAPGSGGGARLWRIITFVVGFASNGLREGRGGEGEEQEQEEGGKWWWCWVGGGGVDSF